VHCDAVECPEHTVCDGFGGCAVPEQLSQCESQGDGMACSYTSISNVHVDGACDQGVCRTSEIPACLADMFSTARVDTGMWNLWLSSNEPVVVSEDTGQLTVTLAPNVGLVYNGVQSRGRYDMIAGDAQVEVEPASQDIGVETDFLVDLDASLGFQMSVYANRLHLVMHTSGGVTSSMAIDFDPVNHRFWRVRHDPAAATMELETSPDGMAWTSRRSESLPRLPTTVTVTLLAGTYTDKGVDSPGAAAFFKLRLVSASCP
jgi:hypothetical protein